MKNFKDNKSFGSLGSFGSDKRGGGFDRGRGGFSGGNRPSFGGGNRPSYGGNRSSFGDDRKSEVFKATCADCQKQCEVPFRPSGDRPVFCSDCFGEKRGASEDTRSNFESRSTYRDAAKPAYKEAPKVDLSVVLAKLDTLIAAVEKLTAAQKEAVQPVVAEVVAEETVAPKAKKVAKKTAAEKKPAKKVASKKAVVKK